MQNPVKYNRGTVSVSIEKDVEHAFRQECKKNNFVMSRIAEQLFRQWLEERKVKIEGSSPKQGS
jgi:stalled ribosome alternative rescue factor ArfA